MKPLQNTDHSELYRFCLHIRTRLTLNLYSSPWSGDACKNGKVAIVSQSNGARQQ